MAMPSRAAVPVRAVGAPSVPALRPSRLFLSNRPHIARVRAQSGDAREVAQWCADRFAEATHPRVPDAAVPIAKCALLLALEDEAAAAATAAPAPAPGASAAAAAAAAADGRPGSPAAPGSARFARTSGGAATWSLSRLDSLAEEALRHFEAQHAEGPPAVPPAGGARGRGSSSGGLTAGNAGPGGGPRPKATGGIGASGSFDDPAVRAMALLNRLARGALGAAAAAAAAGTVLARRVGAEPPSLPRVRPAPRKPPQPRQEQPQPKAQGSAAGAGSSSSGVDGPARRAAVMEQVSRYPMAALGSVNAVLFERQGYAACNRWGVASDALLSSVLEQGRGSCVALALLYTAVCARLGLELHTRVLRDEGGSYYCVAWTAAAPIQAGGVRCVIDVYGGGALLTVKEVCDLFAVSPEALLVPSPRRALLGALLGELQAAHWSAACGCDPSPAARLPLRPSAALRGAVQRLEGAPLERALAAAAKRVALLPASQQARCDLGLLSYFAGRYEDAFLELGILMERAAAGGGGTASADGAAAAAAAAAAADASSDCAFAALAAGAGDAAPAAAPAGGAAAADAAAAAADAPAGPRRPNDDETEPLPPDVLSEAGLLLEKLRLELLLAV